MNSVSSTSTYKDQSDVFYDSPSRYLELYFPEKVDSTFPPSPLPAAPPGQPLQKDGSQWVWQHSWPSHLVLFGALLQEYGLEDFIVRKGYKVVWKTGNGIEEDPRRRGGVQVWQWLAES